MIIGWVLGGEEKSEDVEVGEGGGRCDKTKGRESEQEEEIGLEGCEELMEVG